MSNLLAKLNNDPDVTDTDVLDYLYQRVAEGQRDGLQTIPPEQFWAPGDLDRYKTLVAWWPHDAPPMLGRPYLGVLCRKCANLPGTPMAGTFANELLDMWKRACEWLRANDRNLDNPNETKEERRRRRVRNAVAKHRAHNNSGDPKVDEVRQLYASYIEACQARKAAAATHDKDVADALERWKRAKAELEANHRGHSEENSGEQQ